MRRVAGQRRLPAPQPLQLHCSVCIYVRSGLAPLAATVINGQAVCWDHLGAASGGDHMLTVRAARGGA